MGARATFLVLKSNYNTKTQNSVFLSARDGAEELNVCKDTVCKYLHELEHYGFIVEVQGAHLGVTGTGKAAHYRLTDCYYAGKAPTYDFANWSGELFDYKQNPVRKTRTHRPKNPDSCRAETPINAPECPKNPDIRNGNGCPDNSDITSLTTPLSSAPAASAPAFARASTTLAGRYQDASTTRDIRPISR